MPLDAKTLTRAATACEDQIPVCSPYSTIMDDKSIGKDTANEIKELAKGLSDRPINIEIKPDDRTLSLKSSIFAYPADKISIKDEQQSK